MHGWKSPVASDTCFYYLPRCV